MKEKLNKIISGMKTLETQLNHIITSLPDDFLPNYTNDEFRIFSHNIDKFLNSESMDLDKAEMIVAFGVNILNILQSELSPDQQATYSVNRIYQDAMKLQDSIKSLIPNNTENEYVKDISSSKFHIDKFKTDLKKIQDDYETNLSSYSEQLSKNKTKAHEVEKKLSLIEDSLQSEINKAIDIRRNAETEINDQKKQINDLLGQASNRTVAGSYLESATSEKKNADILRNCSIALMIFIVIIVGFTFWESTADSFKWDSSIFRIALAMILSIPAAYLARESAKHREQQYNHHQTALDLTAITPYIASLPEEEQHRIKAQMADRIFAARDFSIIGNDPYPLNPHELIVKILDKVDLNPKSNKPHKDNKPQPETTE